MIKNKKKKKVLFVLGALGLGGSQRQAFILAKTLRNEYNLYVEFISFSLGNKNAIKLLDEEGIQWSVESITLTHSLKTFLKKFYFIKYINLIIKIRRKKVDFILGYGAIPNIVMGLIWKYTNAKRFVWGQEDIGIDLRNTKVTKLAIRSTPNFISNSPMGAKFLNENYNVDFKKISIIPNGVEIHKPINPKEYHLEITGKKSFHIMVTMVANISKYKNHYFLLKVWKIVVAKWIGDKKPLLCLVGEASSTWNDVNILIDNLELRDHIVLTGFVEDVPGILAISDLAVFPTFSYGEGYPNGVLESMAAGLSVVGTKVESISNLVAESNFELLVTPDNIDLFVEKILYALSNPDKIKKIGRDNRDKIINEFSVDNLVKRTIDLLYN